MASGHRYNSPTLPACPVLLTAIPVVSVRRDPTCPRLVACPIWQVHGVRASTTVTSSSERLASDAMSVSHAVPS